MTQTCQILSYRQPILALSVAPKFNQINKRRAPPRTAALQACLVGYFASNGFDNCELYS